MCVTPPLEYANDKLWFGSYVIAPRYSKLFIGHGVRGAGLRLVGEKFIGAHVKIHVRWNNDQVERIRASLLADTPTVATQGENNFIGAEGKLCFVQSALRRIVLLLLKEANN